MSSPEYTDLVHREATAIVEEQTPVVVSAPMLDVYDMATAIANRKKDQTTVDTKEFREQQASIRRTLRRLNGALSPALVKRGPENFPYIHVIVDFGINYVDMENIGNSILSIVPKGDLMTWGKVTEYRNTFLRMQNAYVAAGGKPNEELTEKMKSPLNRKQKKHQ